MGLHPKDNPIRVAIITWVWGAYLGDEGLSMGIRLKTSSFTRHHVNVMMTKAKVVGNYVNSILAKREVIKAGYDEALLLDTAGYVAEASGENIFLVQERHSSKPRRCRHPAGHHPGLRPAVAQDLGIPVQEERFSRDELYIADEVFLSGTAAELTPVRELDDRTHRLRQTRSHYQEDSRGLFRRSQRRKSPLCLVAHVYLKDDYNRERSTGIE